MELTAGYLHEQFRELNKRYFGDELPEPRFLVSNSRTMLGQFLCSRRRKGLFGWQNTAYTIRISEYYDLPEDEVRQTLLHEMIHYLIAYRGQRDTSAHGRLFRSEMARLNAQGCHITISSRSAQWPVAARNQRRQHLVLLLEDAKGQHYATVIHPDYRKYVERQIQQANQYTLQIRSHHWLVSSSPRFQSYPQSRSLRAHRLSPQEYEEILAES